MSRLGRRTRLRKLGLLALVLSIASLGLGGPAPAAAVEPPPTAEPEPGAAPEPPADEAGALEGTAGLIIGAPPVGAGDAAPGVTGSAVTQVPATIRVLMPEGRIEAMDTETYLKGVVPAEMGFVLRRGLEALKAQAIAARTYAATRCLPETAGDPARCEPGLDANVDTTTRTQVWRPTRHAISDAAVEATRGRAVRLGEALAPTLYFARTHARTVASADGSCCGGSAWPHLQSVASPEAFGQRWGHGSGMSQEGAAVLAAWGASADEILGHYYPGTTVDPPLAPGAARAAPPRRGGSPSSAVEAAPIAAEPGVAAPGAEPSPASPQAGQIHLSGADFRAVAGSDPAAAADSGAPLVIESPVLGAAFPFMALGARWLAAVPEGAQLEIEVRGSRDRLTWSDWLPMLPQESDARFPDASALPPALAEAAAAEGRALPSWARLVILRGQFVQLRATLTPGGAGRPGLESIDLHYINSDAGPSAPAGPVALGLDAESEAPAAPAAAPPIIPRAGWGADERKRFDAAGNEIWPPVFNAPLAQLVHHTVTANDPADPAAIVRAIYQYHAVTQGWGDIGYNYLIDQRGNIYEGRFGGARERTIVRGGHALQFNANTIGVALLGTFTQAEIRPSAAAEAALVGLLAEHGRRYGIQPLAPVTLLGTNFAHAVMGHRDALPGHTACPGNGIHNRLPAIRAATAALMTVPTPPPSAVPPPTAVPSATPLPPPTTVPASATPRPSPTALPDGCSDRVAAGDFEVEDARWQRNRAYYTRWDAFAGQQSLFVGLRNDDPDSGTSFASASQMIDLPEALGSVRLDFAAATSGDAADRRLVRVHGAQGGVITLGDFNLPAASPWTRYQLDLSEALAAHAGGRVQLYFGVVNNGDGQKSYLRLDEVRLLVCPPGTAVPSPSPSAAAPTPSRTSVPPPATPSPPPSPTGPPPASATPEATPTGLATATPEASATGGTPTTATAAPSPTACPELLVDGGFEAPGLSGWQITGDHPALRLTRGAAEGEAALRLGLTEAGEAGFGYAAVAQRFQLPPGTRRAILSLRTRPLVSSSEDAFVVELRRPDTGARQVLLGPGLAQPPGADGAWTERRWSLDLPPAGVEQELYLAVLNRGAEAGPGAVTAIAVDAISLRACGQPAAAWLPWAGRALATPSGRDPYP